MAAKTQTFIPVNPPVLPTHWRHEEVLQSPALKNFKFNDLKVATREFHPGSVIGEGGFGCVYKGWIDENTFAAAKWGTGLVIAVKRLNVEGLQGHGEWQKSLFWEHFVKTCDSLTTRITLQVALRAQEDDLIDVKQ
ncbi:Interleukin-1 receptor-associated kinase 4 [Heracleum sosnowskyi]|uniref:Interleukin-1 receptor-associated kinase 4 n=1 Tax=Heracleum sosnowskyi TaxID=360622 RepID=A0AAD8N3G6_9APIA|nr:Interleukin-1 receptor-associated kinase 4 [Heracleum sosnowskyi]